MTERKIEEALEYFWVLKEEAGKIENAVIKEKFGEEYTDKLLERMSRDGFVELNGGGLNLTSNGEKQAELIVRRHRLAERLLHDVLDFTSDKYESSACQFEHYVGDDVVASICTLLGHPSACPHGKVIPKGECCEKAKKQIKSVVVPINQMRPGDKGKVVYITTKFHQRLDRISSIGILPGEKMTVIQKMPTFVVQIGESQIAFDNNIAGDIFIRIEHS